MKQRIAALAAVAAALTPLASGCSSDDTGEASPSGASPSSTPSPSSSSSSSSSSVPVGERADEPRSSTENLSILITNDDGVAAPGIDALVEVLSVREGVEVAVVAPAENQSGSGGKTSPGPLEAVETATASGHAATAVKGYPADAVTWALGEGGLEPDLVISGINEGQNVGPLVPVSGTVGAARQAAQLGVPALAVSQGLGEPPDFPTGVEAVLDWLDENQDAVMEGTVSSDSITSINVPTCQVAEVQGTVEVPVAAESSVDLNRVDCTSSAQPVDDVTAFVAGWVAVTELPNTGSITS